MEGVGGARGYGAAAPPQVAADGSVSILRRASEGGKAAAGGVEDAHGRPEIAVEGVIDVTSDDAAAAASAVPRRPIGNLGQHLDLQL